MFPMKKLVKHRDETEENMFDFLVVTALANDRRSDDQIWVLIYRHTETALEG